MEDKQRAASTAGGYQICRVWSREGWLYVLDDADIGFFSQDEAENWAREHPKRSAANQPNPPSA
jgi:hypothetical protein